ncbi:hypothetical protein [Spirosoma sp. KNUC1025]|uniref:hypothetical protein n=1 Tax=Spirosoma sp. KNUC1025 TaxID=2894082 RepID=UPI003868AE9B|nr:hypothetical protein LN737_19265 [Spirosoma sp. KNUC1025]
MTNFQTPLESKARRLIRFAQLYYPARPLSSLQLDGTLGDLVDLLLYFKSVSGFMEVYQEQRNILPATRKKAGLETAAYEATEQMYCRLFNDRRYRDRESFNVVLSKYRTDS